MATKVSKPRAYCRERQNSYSLSPISPKPPKRIVDTPRRTRLLRDAKHTAGKIARTELFKLHAIPARTGYRILRKGTERRSQTLSNRGRKRLLQPHRLEAFEAVEDSSFRFASSTHYAVACSIEGIWRSIKQRIKGRGIFFDKSELRR